MCLLQGLRCLPFFPIMFSHKTAITISSIPPRPSGGGWSWETGLKRWLRGQKQNRGPGECVFALLLHISITVHLHILITVQTICLLQIKKPHFLRALHSKTKKTRLMKVTKIGSLGLDFLVIFSYIWFYFLFVFPTGADKKNRVLKSAGSVFN